MPVLEIAGALLVLLAVGFVSFLAGVGYGAAHAHPAPLPAPGEVEYCGEPGPDKLFCRFGPDHGGVVHGAPVPEVNVAGGISTVTRTWRESEVPS
jgi:hypothetical protein